MSFGSNVYHNIYFNNHNLPKKILTQTSQKSIGCSLTFFLLHFSLFRHTVCAQPYNAEVAAWRLARPSTHLVPTLPRWRNYVTVVIRTVSGRRRCLTSHWKMGFRLTRTSFLLSYKVAFSTSIDNKCSSGLTFLKLRMIETET